MLALNLDDSNLWMPVWQLDVATAEAAGLGDDNQIPEQICPIILHNPVLAISVDNPLGKPEWVSAGFLSQNIRSPLIVGGNLTTYVSSRHILLKRVQIVSFLEIQTSDYAIAFRCRYWHKQIQLIVWEYQGVVEQN